MPPYCLSLLVLTNLYIFELCVCVCVCVRACVCVCVCDWGHGLSTSPGVGGTCPLCPPPRSDAYEHNARPWRKYKQTTFDREIVKWEHLSMRNTIRRTSTSNIRSENIPLTAKMTNLPSVVLGKVKWRQLLPPTLSHNSFLRCERTIGRSVYPTLGLSV